MWPRSRDGVDGRNGASLSPAHRGELDWVGRSRLSSCISGNLLYWGIVCCLPQSESGAAGTSLDLLPVTEKCHFEKTNTCGSGFKF